MHTLLGLLCLLGELALLSDVIPFSISFAPKSTLSGVGTAIPVFF